MAATAPGDTEPGLESSSFGGAIGGEELSSKRVLICRSGFESVDRGWEILLGGGGAKRLSATEPGGTGLTSDSGLMGSLKRS